MSKEEIKRIRENYILAYRVNYDAARDLHNKLFDYIEQLQQENQQLKERIISQKREICSINENLRVLRRNKKT